MAAIPAFMSWEPRPYRRPPFDRRERVRHAFNTDRVHMAAQHQGPARLGSIDDPNHVRASRFDLIGADIDGVEPEFSSDTLSDIPFPRTIGDQARVNRVDGNKVAEEGERSAGLERHNLLPRRSWETRDPVAAGELQPLPVSVSTRTVFRQSRNTRYKGHEPPGFLGSILSTDPGENVQQPMVPLVTGELEHRALSSCHRQGSTPRSRPRVRIVNRELVAEPVGTVAREAFDHL